MVDEVVLELRVHGVRGTPTESMLGSDEVRQVAGDDVTGFYRIADEADPPLRTPPATMAIEAYSWGALTSGVRGLFGWVNRVAWLALLPFALVNMAFWARRNAGERNAVARWGLRAVRVAALMLTMVLVLTPCLVAIDLVGWQCFRRNTIACPVLPDWTDRLASFSTGQRMAVTSLVPLAVVGLLVLLSFRTLARYESTTKRMMGEHAVEPADTVGVLGRAGMWRGEDRTRRLQRLHVTVALATVVCFTGLHLVVVGEVDRLVPTTVAGFVAIVLSIGLATTVDPGDLEAPEDPRPGRRVWAFWQRRSKGWYDALAWLTLGVVVVHLVVLWGIRLPLVLHDRNFYGPNTWFIVLFVALTVLHVVLFVGGRVRPVWAVAIVVLVLALVLTGAAVSRGGASVRDAAGLAIGAVVLWVLLFAVQLRVAHRRDDDRAERLSEAWCGAGSSVLLGAATVIALLFTAATVVATANHLNGGGQSVEDLVTRRHEVPPVDAPLLNVTGDVVLRDARVTLDRGTLTVSSGRVVVGGLQAPDSDSRLATVALGSTYLRSTTLVLPPDTSGIRLESSCFGRESDDDYASRAPCTGESVGYRTSGTVLVPASCQVGTQAGRCLQVRAAGDRVALDVEDPPQTPLVVPQILVWTPMMEFGAVVAGAIACLVALLWFRLRTAPVIRAATRVDPRVGMADVPAVAKARVSAAIAHRAERFLELIGMTTSLLALPMLALSLSGKPPWDVFEGLRPFATISLYAVVLVSIGLVLAGSQIRRSAEARRSVGILWDITTFWPRAAHPFAPPCYAERVVPEVTERVRWALRTAPDGVVVLSGHSQGSLICAAVLCQLADDLHRVRLVTYGSQIRAIYGRVFPRAAGPREFGYTATPGTTWLGRAAPDLPTEPAPKPSDLTGLRAQLRRPEDWVNLFRRGDPLGYRVFSDLDDPVLDRPTLEVPSPAWGDPGPRVQGHGSYPHTPEYRETVARWTGEPIVEPPTAVPGVPPLPPP